MDIVSKLEEQIKQLTTELNDTKEYLKKYTAPARSKTSRVSYENFVFHLFK